MLQPAQRYREGTQSSQLFSLPLFIKPINMKNTKQSFLVLSIIMFFVTTSVAMLLIKGDYTSLLIEEVYMLALSLFAGYLVSFMAFLTWKKL